MTDIGFHMRGEIIWRKAAGANGSCAWGSFQSAANPVLRDVHEYVFVFSKGRMNRAHGGDGTIERDAFLRDILSIWDIAPESDQRVRAGAPVHVVAERLGHANASMTLAVYAHAMSGQQAEAANRVAALLRSSARSDTWKR